jgi:hypothetical protein
MVSAAFFAAALLRPVEIAVTPKAIPTERNPIRIGPSPGLRYQSVRSMAHKITKLVAKAPPKTLQNLFRSPPNKELQKIPVKMENTIIHLMGIFGSLKKLLN